MPIRYLVPLANHLTSIVENLDFGDIDCLKYSRGSVLG